KASLRGGRWPSAPSRGDWRPPHLRPQPRVSFGTIAVVTHDRTVAGATLARTRQVTVTKLICGVDVSSGSLDVVLRPGAEVRRFTNDTPGIEALATFCREKGVALVAMEATGGYEKLAFVLLWRQGVPVALANPRSVRWFAEAMGLLEKTDRIDAGVIAWFAETKRLAPRPPASSTQERLEALVTRLRQLTDLRTAQTNQRRLVGEATVLAHFEEMLALIARQIRTLETAIAELIAGDRCGASSTRPFVQSRGSLIGRWPGSWRRCRRSAPCPTRPPPNSMASPRSHRTAVRAMADGRFAADEPACARSSSLWPKSSDGTIRTSPPSTN